SLSGDWTGGFLLNGNWVAVDINLKQEKENLSGSADVVFPSYADSVATRGARLSSLTLDASTIGFEIPVGGEKIVFLGRERGEGISGRFEYGTAKGDFGLARVTYPNPEALKQFYGAYRVAPDRFISIFRGWANPQTLNYVDYKTGQTGT